MKLRFLKKMARTEKLVFKTAIFFKNTKIKTKKIA